ncbi:MAG: glycosyl transferase [Bacteroidales bacterium]|nr:glycosyl transferase [Bacteroidales bacterium]
MIPRTIHYCWFGQGEMPPLAQECIASWHKLMSDWEYRLWNEENFDVQSVPYTAEAYAAGKMAFVSDYVRLWALEREGGIYLDTDVEALRPLDTLLADAAFAGFEGSKHVPVGTCVMASEAHGQWVKSLVKAYEGRHFLLPDGSCDLTTNVQFITHLMAQQGLRQDGQEQHCMGAHIYPVDYFSPRHTTGEYIRTANSYCDHRGLASWGGKPTGWKARLLTCIGQRNMTKLIKLKRRLIG